METIAQKLAQFAVNLKYEDIPSEVIERGKSALLHGISVGACCYNTTNARLVKKALLHMGPKCDEVTMLFDGYKAAVADVAAANAVMFHARIQEDTHGITHPGPILLPLLIATAEKYRLSGKELLTNLIVGYEIACALGKYTTKASNAKGFRATPIYGIVAAAAIAGRALHLNEAQMMAALTYACAFANGLVGRTTVSDEWMYEAAAGVRNAVFAAELALEGAKADPEYFENPKGYYTAFAELPSDPGIITENLGKVWEMRKVMFKFFPSGVIDQAHILNFVDVAQHNDIDVKQIKKVIVKMNGPESTYPGPTSRGPFNDYTQSSLSIPFVCANVLIRKRFTYQDQLLFDDAEILGLMDKVEIVGLDEIPPNCSEIIVEMNDGSQIVGKKELTAEYFNCDYQTEIKLVRGLAPEMIISEAQLEELIKVLEKLEEEPNVDRIIKATLLGE